MSHSPLCLFKRDVLSSRLRRNLALNVVHSLCEILIEEGLASNSEEVLAFIRSAEIDVLERYVAMAEERERKKKKRKMLSGYVGYDYAYIT